jgi:Ser/Thr protein kinase RdoA (MazF antagonist)
MSQNADAMRVDRARLERVLALYPQVVALSRGDDLEIAPAPGGFSGAGVWKVSGRSGAWCLRRWPEVPPDTPRLHELHRWLAHLNQTGAMPVAVPLVGAAGTTLPAYGEALWQVEPWLNGAADLAIRPARDRVAASMRCLAKLHAVSATYVPTRGSEVWFATRFGAAPAVEERLRLLADWTAEKQAGTDRALAASASTALVVAARAISSRAAELRPRVAGQLQDVRRITVPLFPCWRDIWREHMLFSGSEVTGVIDAAAARTESAASDLSRWLGSYLPFERERWNEALDDYEQVRLLSTGERKLLPVLEESNLLLSGLHWAERVAAGPIDDPEGRLLQRLDVIARRLATLVPAWSR